MYVNYPFIVRNNSFFVGITFFMVMLHNRLFSYFVYGCDETHKII